MRIVKTFEPESDEAIDAFLDSVEDGHVAIFTDENDPAPSWRAWLVEGTSSPARALELLVKDLEEDDYTSPTYEVAWVNSKGVRVRSFVHLDAEVTKIWCPVFYTDRLAPYKTTIETEDCK